MTVSSAPLIPVSRHAAPGVRQQSLRQVDLRRGAARPVVRRRVRVLGRDELARMLAEGWPGLMLRKFGSDEACGAAFARTRQTGTNWRSGICKPDGPAVAYAALMWPEDFAALFAQAA